MPEKQLNFLHIFDHANERDEIQTENHSYNYLENKEEAEVEPDKVGEDEVPEEPIKSEGALKEILSVPNNIEGAPTREEKIRNFLRRPDLSLSDFQDFLPEIMAYDKRMSAFRAEYEAAMPGPAKQKIYWKIVNPHLADEPEFRASASLYLAYLDAIKKERNNLHFKSLSNPKKNKPEKHKVGSKKPFVSKHQETDAGSDDGVSRPYEDIYPYSRKWRKE
ncbi:MAG: hypothetical protein PHG95_02025 [Patescibacteria group bacterium]|nr:hypothetical protein [Patescibacteria group bacterium]